MLATLRAEIGGDQAGGEGGRNGLATWGCRFRQGPGEQVEGGNTVSAGTGGGGR